MGWASPYFKGNPVFTDGRKPLITSLQSLMSGVGGLWIPSQVDTILLLSERNDSRCLFLNRYP